MQVDLQADQEMLRAAAQRYRDAQAAKQGARDATTQAQAALEAARDALSKAADEFFALCQQIAFGDDPPNWREY